MNRVSRIIKRKDPNVFITLEAMLPREIFPSCVRMKIWRKSSILVCFRVFGLWFRLHKLLCSAYNYDALFLQYFICSFAQTRTSPSRWSAWPNKPKITGNLGCFWSPSRFFTIYFILLHIVCKAPFLISIWSPFEVVIVWRGVLGLSTVSLWETAPIYQFLYIYITIFTSFLHYIWTKWFYDLIS